jgi:hypothetical protein
LNGGLLVGTTTTVSGYKLVVSGSIYASTHIRFDEAIRDNRDNTIISQSLSSVVTNRILSIGNGTYLNINFPNGNVLVGTTTDAGFKLDVNGTARVSGFTSINSASYNNGAFAVDPLSGQARVAKLGSLEIITTGTPSSTGVGIAVAAANRTLKFYGVAGSGINASDNSRVEFLSQDGVGWGRTSGICRNVLISDFNFSPTSGTATYSGLEVQATINQTGGANGITRGLYIVPTITAAADWRAIEVSAGVSVLAPSTTASATLRIPSGTAPTSPVNGDIWFDGTDLKIRVGGITRTIVLL